MLAFLICWLTYSWTRYAITGGSASSVEDGAALYLLVACIQVCVVRYFGKELIALGRPRLFAWVLLTVFVTVAAYALPLALNILSYLIAKDFIGGWRWHQEAEAAFAATVLFPLGVWLTALLAGVDRIGFKRTWLGVWRDRRLVLVVALTFFAAMFVAYSLVVSAVPFDAGDIELAIWSVVAVMPVAIGYVLLALLAFVTFLAISREDAEEAAIFDQQASS